jgi:hypothetical protein
MKGYPGKYKIRIGAYRIGLSVGGQAQKADRVQPDCASEEHLSACPIETFHNH